MNLLSTGWMVGRLIVIGVAGLFMFWGIYQTITMGIKHQWVQQSWGYLLKQTKQVQQQRDYQYQKQYEEIGIQEKLPLIQRWDQCFAQSMLQQKYPVLNSQLYISLLLMVASLAGFIGVALLWQKPLWGIFSGGILFLCVMFCGVFYVNLIRQKRWKQTEKELMPFLNIVDNFSKSEQDLFHIFELATPYLREPLQSALSECQKHAAATGNRVEAIRDLIYRMEHPKFREMIQNLEICSRNEANYAKIMGDMRDSLSAYMSNRKEESGILREGQVQILVITCMGIPMIAMLTAITQIPLRQMTENFFGRFVIGYWVVLVIVIFYQMFFAGTRRES